MKELAGQAIDTFGDSIRYVFKLSKKNVAGRQMLKVATAQKHPSISFAKFKFKQLSYTQCLHPVFKI